MCDLACLTETWLNGSSEALLSKLISAMQSLIDLSYGVFIRMVNPQRIIDTVGYYNIWGGDVWGLSILNFFELLVMAYRNKLAGVTL